MVKLLDVSSLPGGRVYETKGGHNVDLGEIFDDQLRPVIKHMMTVGLVTETESFGFAMAEPNHTQAWDDSSQLIWMTAGWGSDKDRYVANAARKMRVASRLGDNSIGVQRHGTNTPVQSQEPDGTFAWGDFPYGGAVWSENRFISGVTLLGAVSALTQQEDDAVASMILQVFGLEIYKANHD